MSVKFSIKCPPNTANKRLFWAAKHNLFREIRREVWAALAGTKQSKLRALGNAAGTAGTH